MTIDTHVHMYDGGWPPGSQKGLSSGQMLEAMDSFGISEAWISPVTGLVREYREYNDKLFNFIKHDMDRLIGFYTVNPNYPEEALEEIDRCVEYLGCRGLKLHPWLQAFSVTYSIVDRIVERCILHKLPILFHDGTPPYCDSLQIANVAERYPEAAVILGHAGLYDQFRNAIAAARLHNNIYLCLCGPAIGDIREIVSKVDRNRIIFGSDFGTAAVSLLDERLKKVEYGIEDPILLNKVLYENAKQLIP